MVFIVKEIKLNSEEQFRLCIDFIKIISNNNDCYEINDCIEYNYDELKRLYKDIYELKYIDETYYNFDEELDPLFFNIPDMLKSLCKILNKYNLNIVDEKDIINVKYKKVDSYKVICPYCDLEISLNKLREKCKCGLCKNIFNISKCP